MKNINKIKQKYYDNSFCLNGWLSIPNSFTSEAMGKMGWDSLTLDLQHGQIDYSTAVPLMQSVNKNDCSIKN